jgi:hypothetical protein
MQSRLPRHRPLRIIALSFGTFLAACSGINEFTVFADPGAYEYNSCEQLVTMRKSVADREQELKLLMDRARQSTGGAAIGVIAYQADYVTAVEQLKVIDATARIKKCKMPDEPQGSATAIR